MRRVVIIVFTGLTVNAGRGTIAGPADSGPLPPLAQAPRASGDAKAGRVLFLKNCAHCHGADARGDEGPDLHQVDETDQWLANRIRSGKAGQMTAFDGKLRDDEIKDVIGYLRTLK